MSEIGIKSGKIAPGKYKQGQYRIEKIKNRWIVFSGNGDNEKWYGKFSTLAIASNWCRRNLIDAPSN